ncbi:MAG TPA: Hpt domain-containing protein [Xanthobacteraceae bacterium]|nr:Hpt domain-containing protein [Xanthobacteraceae bacterium]
MPPKADKPVVTTYGEYEVIVPSNPLRTVVSDAAFDPADDPVARAEKALAELSSEFSAWMDEECERLDLARHAVKAKGFLKQTHSDLFHAAHDIKGEAPTFGFPAVAAAADSLCRLLEHTPDMRNIPLALVDQHVDAVRAIYREYARSDAKEMAFVLTRRLREVTDEFLIDQNEHRPGYLEGIVGPPLSPSDIT